jgi:hypothetical protein
MPATIRAWRPAILALAATLAACDGDDAGPACTQEFRTAAVTVVDGRGTPATDATVRTVLVRTGEPVTVTSILDLVPGSYLILDDGAVALIEGDDEAFRVTAARPTGNAVEATYRFAAPGGCHIEKVSGPDTLQVP